MKSVILWLALLSAVHNASFFHQYGEGSIETGGWIELSVKPRLE